MSQWVIRGLRTGIKTTVYPSGMEQAPGVTPGLPSVPANLSHANAQVLADRCPTQVFDWMDGKVTLHEERCVHCFRCVRDIVYPAGWREDYQWARSTGSARFDDAFQRSIHICVLDTGDCGACLNEVKQLNNPYYNMHRLGFFITPTPRHADVLLVVGAVTDHMRDALRKTYEAMPTPKRVIAVGACACTGGIFAGSFVCGKGLSELLPVDVEVPGNPPPPLAILHALLLVTGRKSSALDSAIETRNTSVI